MSKPRLVARLKDAGGSEDNEGYGATKHRWWVETRYRANGKLHHRTQDYFDRRDALNALRALGDGVEIIEP